MPETPTTSTARATTSFVHADFVVSSVGLGCMGMSQAYGPADDDTSIATIRHAVDIGVDLFDTADIYGGGVAAGIEPRFGHNETLLGRALAERRDDVVVATKFGFELAPDGMRLNGRPDYVRSSCDASLSRLGVDTIDLYYCHRVDPAVPVEETVGAMAELVSAGKIRAIGLSEVDAATLERASEVHPIAALQSEYSLWERGIEQSVLSACRALGTTLVPFSPLGRAMLTGQIVADQRFDAADFRSTLPKFDGRYFANNLALVEALGNFAQARDATPGQVALAWLLAQPIEIVPIPGTKRISYLEENVRATAVPLSADDVAELSAMFDPQKVSGERYATS